MLLERVFSAPLLLMTAYNSHTTRRKSNVATYNLCTGRFMHLQNLNSKHSMHKRLYKPLHRAVHSRQLPGHI